MIRNFFVGLVLLVFVNTKLIAGIVIDFDKKLCINNCGNDLECKLSHKVCEYSMTTLVDTVESEVIKRFTQYTGATLAKTGTLLVKVGVYKSKEEAYRILGSNVIYFGNIFAKNGGILIPDKKILAIDKISMINFAIDTTYDIITNEVIEHLNHNILSRIRSLPGINENASDDTIRQALKWMLKLAYNDIRATLYYREGNYIEAAGVGVVDNTLLLADIAVKTYSARDEYFKSKTALAMSKARGKILNLYSKYEGYYLPLKESDEDQKKLKQEMLQKFINECKKIKISFSETHVVFRDALNDDLQNDCTYYLLEMQKNNLSKKYILSNALTNYSKERYNKMIEYYFHHEDWDYYKKLYNAYNFDPDTGYSKNFFYYKHIKKLHAYGVDYYSYGKFINYARKYGLIKYAAGDISDALKNHFGITKTANKIVSDAGYTMNTELTRHIYGKLLVDNFQLKNVYLTKNQKATYLQLKNNGRADSDAILSALEIFSKYKYNSSYNSRIKYFQMLQMIADTLDIVTCGHKNCSYEEIIKYQENN